MAVAEQAPVMDTNDVGQAEQFMKLGQEQAQEMLNLQTELFGAFERANKAWLAWIQSETVLWGALATRMMTTRSVPELMQAYQERLTQCMQTAADEGRRLTEDYQNIVAKVSRSISPGGVAGST